jgi:hypothetical protein
MIDPITVVIGVFVVGGSSGVAYLKRSAELRRLRGQQLRERTRVQQVQSEARRNMQNMSRSTLDEMTKRVQRGPR